MQRPQALLCTARQDASVRPIGDRVSHSPVSDVMHAFFLCFFSVVSPMHPVLHVSDSTIFRMSLPAAVTISGTLVPAAAIANGKSLRRWNFG